MGGWLRLLERTLTLLDHSFGEDGGSAPAAFWTFGGSTVLYREYGHRMSKDIDVAFENPYHLSALYPGCNAMTDRFLSQEGTSYSQSSNFLKLTFPDGDLDFVVAPHLMKPFAEPEELLGRQVMVERPVEILAKKLVFRSADFTARDIFDFSFLIEQGVAQELLQQPKQFAPHLVTIQERIESMRAQLETSFKRIDALAYKPSFQHCCEVIQAFSAEPGWKAGKKDSSTPAAQAGTGSYEARLKARMALYRLEADEPGETPSDERKPK